MSPRIPERDHAEEDEVRPAEVLADQDEVAESCLRGDHLRRHDGDEGVGHRDPHAGQDVRDGGRRHDQEEDLRRATRPRHCAARMRFFGIAMMPAIVFSITMNVTV